MLTSQLDESDLADVKGAWEDGTMAKVGSHRNVGAHIQLKVADLKDYGKYHSELNISPSLSG